MIKICLLVLIVLISMVYAESELKPNCAAVQCLMVECPLGQASYVPTGQLRLSGLISRCARLC
ncbi:hypothetical protein DFA_09999 [Cavenderia fasciculata]|uniref:Uncharacterized protein n=1 Tax=Cavenderia fasciculata TaxID=261658 RepID=F4Q904_CACFS|nr:uncharacterized protein DFA_09999 [Cavenderia fasciculata]EGG15173.1 hypothetical protein DFA_09999 [Cavenderia fasciculata]|eukprot:XP_004351893.1 hypothetical protein DFA_09999 [Cavenderia fasciculata]